MKTFLTLIIFLLVSCPTITPETSIENIRARYHNSFNESVIFTIIGKNETFCKENPILKVIYSADITITIACDILLELPGNYTVSVNMSIYKFYVPRVCTIFHPTIAVFIGCWNVIHEVIAISAIVTFFILTTSIRKFLYQRKIKH